MNQFFNIKRFTRLAAYDVRINYKKYLIAVAIGFVGIFVITYYVSLTSGDHFREILYDKNGNRLFKYFQDALLAATQDIHFTTYGIRELGYNFLLFFSIFVGLSFPALSGRKSAMNYLLLPASVFEKYLLEFIIRMIIGFGLFLLIFYFAANLALGTYEVYLNLKYAYLLGSNHIYVGAFSYKSWISTVYFDGKPTIDPVAIEITFMMVAMYISAFAVRLFFKRFAFFKTAVAVIGSVLLLGFGTYELINKGILPYSRLYLIIFFPLAAVICVFLSYYKLKRRRV